METATLHNSNTVIVTSSEALRDLLRELLPPIVRKEIQEKEKEEIADRLTSPSETCRLFKISKPTLNKWTRNGWLKDHRIGNRVYYKYSEIMSSLQTLKKYKKVA